MAKGKKKHPKHASLSSKHEDHNSVGGYDGGSCLTGHLSKYTSGNSCSYRWQGIKKAQENPAPYNAHGKAYAHLNGAGFPNMAAQGVKNFETGFMPYANQVHHVLPNSVLKNGVDTATNGDAALFEMIGQGLLVEKYNINHKDNMLILPSRWRDAVQVGLPTHCGDHPTYSATVKDWMDAAMTPYKALVDQGKLHDKPDYQDLKETLEQISRSHYNILVAWGQATIKGQDPQTDPNTSVNEFPGLLSIAG